MHTFTTDSAKGYSSGYTSPPAQQGKGWVEKRPSLCFKFQFRKLIKIAPPAPDTVKTEGNTIMAASRAFAEHVLAGL